MSALRHRLRLAKDQTIRSGAEKFAGVKIASLFGHESPLGLDSGDIPVCFGQESHGWFRSITSAGAEAMPEMIAYSNPEYRKAQIAIHRFLSGDYDPQAAELRAHPIGGVSTAMPVLIKNALRALGYDPDETGAKSPYIILCLPTHPNWLAKIVTENKDGYGAIILIKRDKNGMLDIEHAKQVLRKIDRPFIIINIPDENPSGTVTPNGTYTQENTGLIDLIAHGTPMWGMLFLDLIYADMTRGPDANKRHELVQAAKKVRTVAMHSVSKAYGLPGFRMGGTSYLGPLDAIGKRFCSLMFDDSDDSIKNGISSQSLRSIQVMYGNADGRPAFASSEEIQAEKEALVARVFERVDRNHAAALKMGLRHVFGLQKIDSAFYGFYDLKGFLGYEHGELPWSDGNYVQRRIMDPIEARLARDPDSREYMKWTEFREFTGEVSGVSASRAFTLELVMNGLIVLPHDPFYTRFLDNGITANPDFPTNPIIRLVLAHPPEVVAKALETIKRVWEEGITDFKGGNWQRRYD